MSCKCGKYPECKCKTCKCLNAAFCTVCGEAEIFKKPIKDKQVWLCYACNTAHETLADGTTRNMHVIKGAEYTSDDIHERVMFGRAGVVHPKGN